MNRDPQSGGAAPSCVEAALPEHRRRGAASLFLRVALAENAQGIGGGTPVRLSRNDAVEARPTMGSTGVPPVPAGVPPGGRPSATNSLSSEGNPQRRRLGGTPSRT